MVDGGSREDKLDALDTRRSRNGRYPLNYSAWFNHPAAGADPNHANGAGWLPAETAARQGHDDIVELLEAADEPESP